MCIGIPMQVTESEVGYAWCVGRGSRERLDLSLVGTQAKGAWVLAYHGTARREMSADEAAQTNAALDALEAALRGETKFDDSFSDLAGREPQLPEHLRRSAK